MEQHLGQEEGRNYDKLLGTIIENSCLVRVISNVPES